MKFLKSLFFFSALFVANSSIAQLVVENGTLTVEQLVNDVLLGDGVDATNITYNGMPGDMVSVQTGTFNSENSNIPITSGLIMATGNANVAVGPNIGGGTSDGSGFESFNNDPDLEQAVGITVNDCAIIEFDFIAASDSLKFNYVFASEEYNEFVCQNVNDVFGFFLSGGSINGPYSNNAINIALVPGTDIPVSINTVSNGTDPDAQGLCAALDPNWQDNSVYFIDNEGNNDPNGTEFDGFTVVLEALAAVECGVEYHIKLAIGDGGDTVWDSAVFLEEGSFSAFGEIFASFDPVFNDGGAVNQEGYDSIAVAGCTNPIIELVRPTGSTFSSIEFQLQSDNAVEGVDYELVDGFPTGFPAGIDTVNFEIETLNPNITDTLFLDLLIIYESCAGEQDTTIVVIPIAPPPFFEIFAEDQTLVCPNDTPFVYGPTTGEGGLLPYIYDWLDLETYPDDQDRIFGAPEDEQLYTVRVTDQCEFRYDTTSFNVINNFPPPLSSAIDPFADPVCPNEPVDLTVVAANGVPPYGFTWSDSRNSDINNGQSSTTADDINPATIAFTPTLDVQVIVIDDCGTTDTARVTINYPIYDSLAVSFTPLFDNCPEISVLLESIVEGGAGDFTYTWGIEGESTFADGFGPSTANTFIDAGSGFNTFTLSVQDRCNRAGHDMFLRTDEDGMPIFSGFDDHEQTIPYIKLDPLPNIITPNGDGQNEVFVVPGIDAFENASVLIYDRWGKLIYENNSYDAGVPGEATISQGFSADGFSDGTYLYIINIDSGECVAQGNLSVVRGNE
jgi:gliding motility-associated-like protein